MHQWVKYSSQSCYAAVKIVCICGYMYICTVHMTEDIHDRPPYAVQCNSSPQQGNPSVIFVSGVLFA